MYPFREMPVFASTESHSLHSQAGLSGLEHSDLSLLQLKVMSHISTIVKNEHLKLQSPS